MRQMQSYLPGQECGKTIFEGQANISGDKSAKSGIGKFINVVTQLEGRELAIVLQNISGGRDIMWHHTNY